MNYKSKIIFSLFLFFSFLLITTTVFASTTLGTIDSTYKYAYGENVGFIDFGSTAGNVQVTDSALTGYAYGENIGWINLSGITNSNGTLSGYAWGENVGFIDFSKVTIGNDGVFSGSAYGENIGWITFGTTNNKVATDWRKPSLRKTNSSSGSTIIYGCKDPKATNYNAFSASKPELCKYGTVANIKTITTTPKITTTATTRILKLTTKKMKGDDCLDYAKYGCRKYDNGNKK